MTAKPEAAATQERAGDVGTEQVDFSTSGSILVPSAGDMHAVGVRLGENLSAGAVVVLTGALGAGKTTLTQGIARGLGVRGRVQSPTFTIVRTHKPGQPGGVGLLHMDAYRLLGDSVAESISPGESVDRHVVLDALESLAIDASLGSAVLVAEWGRGVVEFLSERVLDVEITRDLPAVEPARAAEDLKGTEGTENIAGKTSAEGTGSAGSSEDTADSENTKDTENTENVESSGDIENAGGDTEDSTSADLYGDTDLDTDTETRRITWRWNI